MIKVYSIVEMLSENFDLSEYEANKDKIASLKESCSLLDFTIENTELNSCDVEINPETLKITIIVPRVKQEASRYMVGFMVPDESVVSDPRNGYVDVKLFYNIWTRKTEVIA